MKQVGLPSIEIIIDSKSVILLPDDKEGLDETKKRVIHRQNGLLFEQKSKLRGNEDKEYRLSLSQ